jgi:uracil-DNA glycosylase
MEDDSERTTVDLVRIAQQHIESLKAAGVQWLPAPSMNPPLQGSAESPAPSALSGESTLFDECGADETPADPSQRRKSLEVLSQKVSTCVRCAELVSNRTQTVFGVGSLDPEICFVGEAPGADEDAQGEPFVGAAGQLLNRIIAACGMKREEVYICNILKCRPPGNRLPQVDEAHHCREYLEAQLALVHPKFICALGACAAQNLLNTSLSIGKLRGQFHNYRGIPVLCTYHPAYLLRSPDKKKDVWEDMKKLMQRLGRPVKS